MKRAHSIHRIVPGKRRGAFLLPDASAEIHLNPMESTLYRLFLAHPEGIPADGLLLHWQELCTLYEQESCFDDPPLRADALESLCAESKRAFYTNISRIKKKFVAALGARKAVPYIIRRGMDGLYRTLATKANTATDSPGNPLW